MRLIALLLSFLFISKWTIAQSRIPYEFKQYTLSDGLPSNTVYGGYQDTKGFIWFYTISGVCRFDGRRFQNLSINDSLADNETLSGFEDSRGRMWFNAFNGRLAYFDTKTEKIISYRTDTLLEKANGNSYISSIREDAEHNIWILNERKSLTRISPDNRIFRYDNRHKEGIYGILTDEKHRLYSLSDSLYLYNPKSDSFETVGFLTKTAPILKMAIKGSTLFFETFEGIMSYKGGQVRVLMPRSAYAGSAVSALDVDALGHLWIGLTQGALKYSLSESRVVDYQYTGGVVSNIFSDNEGNIWLTTLTQGVFFLPVGHQNIRYLGVKDGLKNITITAITRDAEGDILIAASPDDLYYVSNKGKIKAKIHLVSQKPILINKLYFHKNDLWIQIDNNHLRHIPNFYQNVKRRAEAQRQWVYDLKDSDTRYKGFDQPIVDFDNFMKALNPTKNIFISSKGDFFIGAMGLVHLTPLPEGKALARTIYGQAHSRFYALAEDAAGHIWFAGAAGLGDYDPETSHLNFYSNITETSINDILLLANGYILLSTSGSGLYLCRQGRVVYNWRQKNGLSSSTCLGLFKQSNHQIWVGTDKGVTYLDFGADTVRYAHPNMVLYGGKDNRPALYINDLYVHNDWLYMASNEGLYAVNTAQLPPQIQLPTLRLTAPAAFLEQPDSVLQLAYSWVTNKSEMAFTFRAIAFLNGEDMWYKYHLFQNNQLVKIDSIRLNEDFNLLLPSLSTGHYVLEVSCSRGDGLWSAPVKAQFVVQPPLLRHPWALMAYALGAFMGLFAVLRWWSRRRIAQRQAQLDRRQELLAIERRQLTLEQETVRARIDPHFVFNALNGLLTYVYRRDFDSIKLLLPKLSRFIRLSLNLGKEEFISVTQEMAYLNDYLTLEKMRFEGRFEFSIAHTEGGYLERKVIPPLLLQIFVENALKHGISALPESVKGQLNINFVHSNDCLYCTISDNGIGLTKARAARQSTDGHVSMGIELALRRIQLLNQLHGENYRLTLAERKDTEGGTVVNFIINNIN